MEEASSSTSTTNPALFQILGVVLILYGPVRNTWGKGLGKCLSRLWSSLNYRLELGNSSNTLEAYNSSLESYPKTHQSSTLEAENIHGGDSLYREDVEMVMKKLGLSCGGAGQEKLTADDITRVFEEEEPSLEEVKEAFDVFDANGDGFIDAKELQTVLCGLGFVEGKEMEDCQVMIRAFDDNRDGRIDFGEFVKFMEHCFC